MRFIHLPPSVRRSVLAGEMDINEANALIQKSFNWAGFQETGDDSTVKRVDYRSANLTA